MPPDPPASTHTLRGIGISPGFASGPLHRVVPVPRLPPPSEVVDVQSEVTRAHSALAAVATDLTRRADSSDRPTVVEILRAQVMMVSDPVLAVAVADEIRAGADAVHGIERAIAVHRAAFEAAGGYLAERVADLDDLRDRSWSGSVSQACPWRRGRYPRSASQWRRTHSRRARRSPWPRCRHQMPGPRGHSWPPDTTRGS